MAPARVPRKIEVIDDATAEMLRRKTGAERLAIASRMYAAARTMLLAHLRQLHPDWSEERITREAGRRLSHGAA
jgi:hypothetical protein